MQEIATASISYLHLIALDTALRAALVGKVDGIRASIGTGFAVDASVRMVLMDSATAGDLTTALATAQAHDPVFLSVNKSAILANGVDQAVITVNAPKAGAAVVTLSINGADVPVTLTAGVGTISITASDPATITATVKNPGNRSTDQIVISAA